MKQKEWVSQMMGLDKQMKRALHRQEWKVLTVYQLVWVVAKVWKEGSSSMTMHVLKESSDHRNDGERMRNGDQESKEAKSIRNLG
jgi:hypothetical protein